MKTPPQISVAQLLEYGEMLIDDGQPAAARKFFLKAIEREPDNIDALLLLSGVCERGEDSLRYLARVLEIDPRNERARAGIRWARKRVSPSSNAGGDLPQRSSTSPTFDHAITVQSDPQRAARSNDSLQKQATSPRPDRATAPAGVSYRAAEETVPHHIRSNQPETQKHSSPSPAASILLGGLIGLILIACVAIGALWLFGPPQNVVAQIAPAVAASATPTLAPMATAVPTLATVATSTPTLAPTAIVEPAPTLEPTTAPTEVPIDTPVPTLEPTIEPTTASIDPAPAPSTDTTRWIDVDLTRQVLIAYEGDTVVRTTLVSTGLPGTPTVTGQYNIYVKYPAQLMYGPGYYLPDVPWVMYFYNDYGLHGTYWHNNFGQPMSHGCVNLPTPEAEWLYNWASIGTLVNVHY
jgi:lipoprotein-anchoring transpeptidase ErfK/SrfK